MFCCRMTSLLLGVLLVAAATDKARSTDLYVAPNGDDSNPGTMEKPFRSLERVRDAARGLTAASEQNGATIHLRGGVYPRSATFELDERDSETTYKAYRDEAVQVIGGIEIPNSAVQPVENEASLERVISEAARSLILQVDLRTLGITDYGQPGPRGFRRPYVPAPLELFIDGQALTIAQWPNPGEPRVPMGKVLDKGSIPRTGDFTNRGGVFHYDSDRPDRWTKATDIWLYGLFNKGYADDMVKVARIDPSSKTITTVQPTMYGYAFGKPFQGWVAKNLLEEIDLPGEYFVDSESGLLYFFPPEDFDRENSRILCSTLQEPLVALENASFVRFENIIFECSRGIGVYIERGESCALLGCTLRNLGIVAVSIGMGVAPDSLYRHGFTGTPASRVLGSWHEHIYDNTTFNRHGGRNHLVQSCDIYNIGAGGVSLGGGDRKTLEPASNAVVNCDIHHFNRLDASYKGAVNIDGVGNRIAHCHIHDCPDTAIYLYGNDHVIEYNEVDRAVMYADEHGAFYMGRGQSEYGNVIRFNHFHDIGRQRGGHGAFILHFDDGACGTRVFGNLFSRNEAYAIRMNGAVNNVIENNIFVDTKQDISYGPWNGRRWYDAVRDPLHKKRLREDIDILKPPYSKRYPDLVRIYNAPPEEPRPNLVRRFRSARSPAGVRPCHQVSMRTSALLMQKARSSLAL